MYKNEISDIFYLFDKNARSSKAEKILLVGDSAAAMETTTKKLPFKTNSLNHLKPPSQPILKPFIIGICVGAFLEFSMIKFGYYDALINAEAKRQMARSNVNEST